MECENYILFKIKQLISSMVSDMPDCLLLIRQASKTSISSNSQLTIDELLFEGNGNEISTQTPWGYVVDHINLNCNKHIPVITYAMRLIKPQLSIFDSLVDSLHFAKIDKTALSSIYEYILCKKARETAYAYD